MYGMDEGLGSPDRVNRATGPARWLAICVALVLVGCSSAPLRSTDPSGLPTNRPVARADLLAIGGARLFYPSSTIVRRVGADQTPTSPGQEPNPAYTGAILTARATPDQLYAWYGSQLRARGFDPANAYRPASQTSARAWQIHHRLQVQVGVFDPGRLAMDQGLVVPVPMGAVVYEMTLVGYPPGLPRD